MRLDAKRAEIAGKPVNLTMKEFAMLELMALRQGSTLTKEMFLNHLYGGMDEPEIRSSTCSSASFEKNSPGFGRQELHRDRMGSGLRASGARAGEARRVDSPLLVDRRAPAFARC